MEKLYGELIICITNYFFLSWGIDNMYYKLFLFKFGLFQL